MQSLTIIFRGEQRDKLDLVQNVALEERYLLIRRKVFMFTNLIEIRLVIIVVIYGKHLSTLYETICCSGMSSKTLESMKTCSSCRLADTTESQYYLL